MRLQFKKAHKIFRLGLDSLNLYQQDTFPKSLDVGFPTRYILLDNTVCLVKAVFESALVLNEAAV